VIRNPKLEIRNKPNHSNPKFKNRNQNQLVWNFVLFDYWDLFRISDFEFFWPLAPFALLGFARVALTQTTFPQHYQSVIFR